MSKEDLAREIVRLAKLAMNKDKAEAAGTGVGTLRMLEILAQEELASTHNLPNWHKPLSDDVTVYYTHGLYKQEVVV